MSDLDDACTTLSMLTTKEVALAFDAHPETVRRWAREGQIKFRRVGLRKELRFSQAEVLRFAKRRGFEIVNPFVQSVAE